MKLPVETLSWMLERARGLPLRNKLKKILTFADPYKQNRWFGYYQRVGEQLKLWTLDEVIARVSAERGAAECSWIAKAADERGAYLFSLLTKHCDSLSELSGDKAAAVLAEIQQALYNDFSFIAGKYK